MIRLRRRPTLEIHVPASPTTTFLTMFHYLARSLRANGGRYRNSPLILTLGAEVQELDIQRRHPWLTQCGVEVRWVEKSLFERENWFATACERFRYEYSSDVVLILDADTLIAGPLDEMVEKAYDSNALCGVIAHVPPFRSRSHWEELYRACNLGQLETPHEHTGWGYLFDDESLRFCPPYFNLGVLAAPAATIAQIGADLYDLVEAVDRVERTNYRIQIALALAIRRFRLGYCTLPFRWNFANDPYLEALHAAEIGDVRIIHLLRQHQLYKTDVYQSIESVERMLARPDLRVINAIAQGVIANVHDIVKAERSQDNDAYDSLR